MIVFDIDDTISPTKPPKPWDVPHETARAVWELKIPTYVLEFLRSRDDIALLSTWGDTAQNVADAFGFKATILVMDEDKYGSDGKYALIKSRDDITAWIDDHIKPAMAATERARGIVVIRPKGGVISEKEIDSLRKL
jgi:hypothetical protein